MNYLLTALVLLSVFGFCPGINVNIPYNKFKYEEFCYEDLGGDVQEFHKVRSSASCAWLCGVSGPNCVSFVFRYSTSECLLKNATFDNKTMSGCSTTDLAVYGIPTTEDPLRQTKGLVCKGGTCTSELNGYRLCQGGPNGQCDPFRGRLEVFHDGVWGTVCDDLWSNTNSIVTCNMFGYSGGTYSCCADNGYGTGPIFLDDVECTGDEPSPTDCSHLPFSSHNCGHGEDVSVNCDNF